MSIKVASGRRDEVSRVIGEISQDDVRVVFFFFSPDMEGLGLVRSFAAAFPAARRLGASMIGGWSSKGALERGIVAMSLSGQEVEESFVAFREGVKADPEGVAKALGKDMGARLGPRRLDPLTHVGILLFDGLCLGERIVHELATERRLVLPIVGGAAADELDFKRTLVACDEALSADGVALLVLKMRIPFHYGHYVHYRPTAKAWVVTKAEPGRRVVWELDGQPAAERYARSLGLASASELQNRHFARNPLGVAIGDTVYARSPNAVIEGRGLQFYCSIEAGTRVSLLEQGDLLENARQARAEALEYLPSLQGCLLFNCVLRYLEMKEDGLVDRFNGVFSDLPFIGFNTYGEELFTHHNQTLTALFLGGKEPR